VDWAKILTTAFATAAPMLPPIIGIFAVIFALILPVPGRGPRILQRQDSWRRFKGGARREVMARAGNRCEGAVFLAWGRCPDAAEEADHIYPWSKYGPTTPSNGQALCKGHNRNKGAMRPAWWYTLSLERRRRSYFPPEADVRVNAKASKAELATHVKRKP
jgi:hypothetical protein